MYVLIIDERDDGRIASSRREDILKYYSRRMKNNEGEKSSKRQIEEGKYVNSK